MRCILYARYSTDLQTEASIDSQFAVCREYVAVRGWKVAAEFADRGISGTAIGNRPQALAAISACLDGDVLVVNDITRLSRSQDLAPLLSRLKHRGVRVIGVQDSFDSDSRTARMQAGFSGIMSEEFCAMIGQRAHAGQRRNALEGKPTGGKLYENAEVVQEAFARFANGESLKAIANDFNRRGIPSPGATWKPRAGIRGRWLVSALHSMLKNERYVGRLVWNKSKWVKDPDTGKRLRRERPESDWIVRQVEPMVDQETWDRAQARFRMTAGRANRRSYVLSGLLECSLCGAKLIVVGGSQRRYVCSQNHGGGDHACPSKVSLPRLAVERAILDPIVSDLLSPAAIKEAIAEMRKARSQPAPVVEPHDREVVELERLVREGVLSRDVAAPALVEARRKAAARRIVEPMLDMPWPSEKLWRETVAQMREVLCGQDAAAARLVLMDLVGPVRCEPAEGGVIVELATRQFKMTGSGIHIGSGGVQRTYIRTHRVRFP
jgi:site-specific DNA recombinase